MKFEQEQMLRNEARALKEVGILTWDRRLRANGLDPERWSNQIETEREPAEHEETARLVDGLDFGSEVEEAKAAVRKHPELFSSTRTKTSDPRDEVYGLLRSTDLGSFDSATNTIECVWTTGASVLRCDGVGYYNEVLDVTPKAVRLGRLNAGASFLNSHQSDDLAQVLGAVVRSSAKMQDGKGICRILLSKAAGCADAIDNIKAGVIRNCSVGYIIHASQWTDEGDAGYPTCRVTDWEPYEISAVAIPADPGAQFRMLATAPRSADPAVNAARARARIRMRMRTMGIG